MSFRRHNSFRRQSALDDSIAKAILTTSINDIILLCCNIFAFISYQRLPHMNCAFKWLVNVGFLLKNMPGDFVGYLDPPNI